MHDGAIVFKSKIDNSELQKDLNKAKREIEKSQKTISESEAAKLPLEKHAENVGEGLNKARQELEKYQAMLSKIRSVAINPASRQDYERATQLIPGAISKVVDQKKVVEKLENEWSQVNSKIEKYNSKITSANANIELQKEKAAEITKKLSSGRAKMAAATEKAQLSAEKFKKRLVSLAGQAFVFTLISKALQGIVKHMGKALKSNKEFTSELAKLKGSLLTAFQPIYELLLPALMALMRIATNVITAVARVAAMLGGKSMSQYAKNAEALYNEANAIEKTGDAAKKAQRSLAGFDEINQLGSNANNESAPSSTDPNFSLAAGIGDMSDETENLLGIISAITAGFLAWKMASSFLSDGKLAAGIGLTVAGLGLLAVGIWDVTQNGFKLENVLTIIAGLLTAGLGIGLLTGSWIPLLIAAIASLLLSIVYFTGNGEELLEGLKQTFGGVYDFIAGVFTGDFDRAIEGLKNIVKGFASVFNVVFDSIKQCVSKFFVWLNEKTGGKFSSWISATERSFSALVSGIRSILNGLIAFVSGAFTGNWKKAWEGVKSVFSGIWNAIAARFEFVINGVLGFLNAIIVGINKIHLAFGGKDYGIGNTPIAPIAIPRLARGAVIPPNREFMAVLGDQRHGTNIEAPEGLIRDIFKEEMGDFLGGMMAGFEALLEENRSLRAVVEGIEVGDTTIGQAANRYNDKMAVVRGRA